MLELINKVYELSGLSHRMRSDYHVIIYAPNYYKNVPKILDETPKHVVANYLGWIIASQLGIYTGNQFKNISDQYKIDIDEILLGKYKEPKILLMIKHF